MGPAQAVRQTQGAWAQAQGRPLDPRGYVRNLESNLREPPSAHARSGFRGGSGSELASHMRAPHSSSALAANVFDHWTERDRASLLSALGIEGDDPEVQLDLEAQGPTDLGGTPTNLDVAIRLRSGAPVAVGEQAHRASEAFDQGQGLLLFLLFPSVGRSLDGCGLAQLPEIGGDAAGRRLEAGVPGPRAAPEHLLALAKPGQPVHPVPPPLRLFRGGVSCPQGGDPEFHRPGWGGGRYDACSPTGRTASRPGRKSFPPIPCYVGYMAEDYGYGYGRYRDEEDEDYEEYLAAVGYDDDYDDAVGYEDDYDDADEDYEEYLAAVGYDDGYEDDTDDLTAGSVDDKHLLTGAVDEPVQRCAGRSRGWRIHRRSADQTPEEVPAGEGPGPA